MTRDFPSPNLDAVMHRTILVEAARCWRKARDAGQSVQPCLYRALAPHDCEMLAPVFDSLMTLCENALGRQVAVGEAATLSSDEHMLLNMIDGSKPRRACIDCPESAATSLDCAICSTRIMMGLAMAHHTDNPGHHRAPVQVGLAAPGSDSGTAG